MKLLSNHKLSADQFEAVQIAETILNSVDFKGWFLNAKFTELANFADSTNAHLYMKFFVNNEHRFSWVLVKRPWYKRFSPAIGMAGFDGEVHTYLQVYEKMSVAERAGHIAHEIMHIIGFTHSFKKSESRDKSLPYRVGDYVTAAAQLMLK
jgi:hypothetical protein